MANLGHKNGIYHVRFRYLNKEYKRSLKTHDRSDAEAAVKGIEQTMHLLTIGQKQIPEGVDAGDFIASGGTIQKPRSRTRIDKIPVLSEAVDQYLESEHGRSADSYIDTQRTHLKHFKRFLNGNNGKAENTCNAITFVQLDRFIQSRQRIRDASTVSKERNTLRRFFSWCQARQYVESSPAQALLPIPHGSDRDPFKTKVEIEEILGRGGASDDEIREQWACLYLTMAEIGGLLKMVRERAKHDTSFLLHAIPAYTGLRRGEIVRLRWSHVDLERRTITAYSRKQSRSEKWTPRDIELHEALRRELVAWQETRPKGQFVLCHADTLAPLTKDQASRYFLQPMRRTEWCLHGGKNWFKVTFHTYRHSFASNLASLGVDERIIDRFMGHQTDAMRRRYRHLFPADRRSALAKLSFASENETK